MRFAPLLTAAALAAGCSLAPGRTPPHPADEAAPAAAAERAPGWDHAWARDAVFYEVFVRSFADSDGDGIGDLRGLTARLDDLNDGDPATTTDLGVDGLWLMPIFASPSYHGYDTTDYESINPDYGTLDDFDTLLAEAHRRGIRVILDFVMNHTSDQHPWFVESASSPASPRRDWYVWRADDPGWTQPWGSTYPTWHPRDGAFYYGIFWSGMPDLNFRTPAVRREIERLAELWLDRGVDGFRLDATRHLVADGPGQLQNDTPETHAFLRELSAAVRRSHPQALLVGENWTDTATIAPYFGSTAEVTGGDELPLNFDFPLAAAIVEGVRSGDPAPIAATLASIAELYPPGVLDAPFLTNHDMIRIASQLDGDERRLGTAAALLLTLPGVPFLYYGEEVGVANGPGRDDTQKRTPMPWDDSPGGGFTSGTPWFPFAPGRATANVAAERGTPGSLWERYRALIALRHAVPALGTGTLAPLPTGAVPTLLAYLRRTADDRVLVIHNLGETAVEAAPLALDAAALEPLFVDAGVAASHGDAGWRAGLPPGATGVWRLR